MPCLSLLLEERELISAALLVDPHVSWSYLAAVTGRHRTTIAREVEANGGRGRYRPVVAERRAAKGRARPKTPKLSAGPLRERITAELRRGRSPYAIRADLVAEHSPLIVSVETIYTAVFSGILDVKPSECLRSRRPRRRHRQHRHPNRRPALANVAQRPSEVNDRIVAGHWEIDHIIGARNRSALMTFTERLSRYCFAITMPCGYDSNAALAGLVEGLERIPAHLRCSITFDQGSEWAEWETIAATYGIDVWFCDPHSPWQRGQIENQNRQWRWWFPRGTNLARLLPATVDAIADLLNNQRRRLLHDQTPAHLYSALTVR